MHQRKGIFTVKSAYKVAREVLSEGRVVESSQGCTGKEVWPAIWKLRILSKIKVFGWRACNEILPTKLNLSKKDYCRCDVPNLLEVSGISCLCALGLWCG